MNKYQPPKPAGYLWRRYEMGRPVYIPQWPIDPQFKGYILWPAFEGGQLPTLNRWAGLKEAFAGFVTRSWEAPFACAYDMKSVLRILQDEIITRSWNVGADAAELTDFLYGNLLGVWLGERTPFLVSTRQTLDEEVHDFFKSKN